MKRIILLSLVVCCLISTEMVTAQDTPLVIDGNKTETLNGIIATINGFTVSGNSSLVIENAHINMMDAKYNVNESGSLKIINSTIKWQGEGGIRLHDDSETQVTNSTIYMEYELGNRTYYGQGFGLSEQSTLDACDSLIGYVKLTDSAKCNASGGLIGEFGSTSKTECTLEGIEVGSLILTYEKSWVRFNSTLQRSYWRTSDIVRNGTAIYPVTFERVTMQRPPSFQLLDCNFEANNTEVDLVLIGGNSGLTIKNVDLTLLYLIEDVWATISESNLKVLRCRNGDFNVKVTSSDVETLETMMTSGFNLKLLDTMVGNLNLMYAHPEAPNNIEIINTTIKSLHLTPSSPPVYMFERATIQEKVVLEAGDGSNPAPYITGSLSLGEGCVVEHDEREGVTEVARIYMFTVENNTTPEQEYVVAKGNHTLQTGTVGEDNTIVFPVKYRREYRLIENPQQGGPYLTDMNNFTDPLTLHIAGQEIALGFTSNTPIEINLTKETASTTEPETMQPAYTMLAAFTGLAALGVIAVSMRSNDSTQQETEVENREN